MKKIGLIAAICFAFAMCMMLAGCGGGQGDPKEAFSGTWDLLSLTQGDVETSEEDVKTLAALGMEVHLDLNEDGSAELDLFDDVKKGTWEVTAASAGTITLDGDAVDMIIEDETLSMTQGDTTLYFKKGEAKAASASGEAASEESDSEESADEDAAEDDSADDESEEDAEDEKAA